MQILFFNYDANGDDARNNQADTRLTGELCAPIPDQMRSKAAAYI